MPRRTWRTGANLRRRLYEILEHGTIGDRTAVIVGRLIVILIVVNLVAMTLDSVPALEAQYGPLFIAIELLLLVLFSIEYVLRVWYVLMDRERRIAEHIREVARARVGGDMVTRKGDPVVEELDEGEAIHQPAHSRSGGPVLGLNAITCNKRDLRPAVRV